MIWFLQLTVFIQEKVLVVGTFLDLLLSIAFHTESLERKTIQMASQAEKKGVPNALGLDIVHPIVV
jgi:hypothetical protein